MVLQVGTLGITKFASDALGDIIHVEMPKLGKTFEAGKELVGIESVKTAADVLTPVAGKVCEVNPAMEAPETLSEDPEVSGWLLKIEFSGDVDDATRDLMDEEAYSKYCEEDH